ncbi:MAG: hypothetical protein P4N59_16920 [Negativicutes bacterium]|nr:hypothetical protein [Negativicutes bacterium]
MKAEYIFVICDEAVVHAKCEQVIELMTELIADQTKNAESHLAA